MTRSLLEFSLRVTRLWRAGDTVSCPVARTDRGGNLRPADSH